MTHAVSSAATPVISLERRGIYELGEVHPRSYGVKPSEIPAAVTLNLSHNHLRMLQRPFARPELAPAAPQQPHQQHQPTAQLVSTSPAAAATVSLEEESSALRPFTSLAHLHVCHNQLRSLTGLCGAANTLTVLVATHNALTSLEGLQGCRRLTYVDLSYNAIASLRGLPLTSLAAATSAPHLEGRRRRLSSLSIPAAAAAGGDGVGAGAAQLTPAALAAAAAAAQDADGDIDFAVMDGSTDGDDDEGGSGDGADSGHGRRAGGSVSTSSISFSLHTSIAAGSALDQRRRSRAVSAAASQLHARGGGGGAVVTPLLAMAGASRSANTSVQFDVDDTVAKSAGEAARPRGAGLPASSPPSPLTPHGARAGGVVLVLAHNRLRGAALRSLIWANAGEDAAAASACTGTTALLRPWCAALTHLDLSYNYVEDVRDVRRLLQPIPWPVLPSASGSRAVWAPPLTRLRRLDVSGNAFLVNGSLAEELARPPCAATSPAPLPPPDVHPTSVRRSTLAPSQDALADTSAQWVGPSIKFQLSYASASLAAALRTCGGAAEARLTDVTAARAPMQGMLQALAERWCACVPSAAAAIGPGAFALFAEKLKVAWHTAKVAPCAVQLRGGEVTVLAAALRERGAHLGDVLAVPSAASPLRPAHTSPATRPSRRDTGLEDGGDAAMQAVFLTPPPQRQRLRGAAAVVGTDASALSSGGGGGGTPPAAREAALQRPAAAAATADGHDASRQTRHSTTSTNSSSSSSHPATSHADASAQGYRLYHGRGATHRPTQPLPTTPQLQSSAHVPDAEAATRHAGPARAPQPHPNAHGAALTTDAVALQLLRAEVGELRRRYRELQRQTRDQTCVLQRHEATMREMRAATAQAVRERQAAQIELAKATQEVERLREQLQLGAEARAPTLPPERVPSTEHA